MLSRKRIHMNILVEALVDTGRLVPMLALIYFLVAFLEYRYGDRMGHFIMHLGAWGPVAGALFGCMPQCGFSVVAAALYVKRFISLGTLLAVFISTSDEAVPVLLTMPQKAPMVGLLIIVKVAIALISGITIDFFMNRRAAKEEGSVDGRDKSYQVMIDEHKGCCSHALSDSPSKVKALFWHPLMHTVKIYIFLLVLTISLSFVVGIAGQDRIRAMLLSGTILQPVIAAFIGLIPNCFASVFLAELYAKNAISFGSLIAGLCAGAGLGLLVLIKESKQLKDALKIIGLLLTISILAGIIIQGFK